MTTRWRRARDDEDAIRAIRARVATGDEKERRRIETWPRLMSLEVPMREVRLLFPRVARARTIWVSRGLKYS